MKSHATIVRDLITVHDPIAVSCSMGYMVTRSNDRVNFSDHYGDRSWHAPREADVKRDRNGRCTALTAVYADGSRLRFTWNNARGSAWRVLA